MSCKASAAGATPRQPWPDWLEWNPNRIWVYDFTHFTRAGRVAIAILDVVSRKWLTTLVSAEETSTQVEVAFTAALEAEGLLAAADDRATAALRVLDPAAASVIGQRIVHIPDERALIGRVDGSTRLP